jgi:hypothetical protein
MREYGQIHASFWANEALRALDSDAKVLALYLLTSSHTHASGAFRLPDAYACDDLGWPAERLRNGFQTLSSAGFIVRCTQTGWVWICKFHEWNKPANPNIRTAIVRFVGAIPEAVCFREKVTAIWDVSETVVKPLRNTPSPSPYPSLLLKDGTEYEISADMGAEFATAYPGVDVAAEVAKMRAWLVANGGSRKTRAGTPKFINGWLARVKVEPKPPVRKRRELGT